MPANVELVGYLDKQRLNDFIRSSRFVVMPSRCYEGFPMAILEAACFGKPTVGPDHGGFTEIIGKGNEAIGRLFVPGDTDDMESNIVELWNNPDLVSLLGKKAFEKLHEKYCLDSVYKKWENLLVK